MPTIGARGRKFNSGRDFAGDLGSAAQARAREEFSANAIVPRYEALYRRVYGCLNR